MSLKTKIYVAVMSIFLVSVLFLTYYSKHVFNKNLPMVSTVMPVMGEMLDSGRYSYTVPTAAIRRDETGKIYVLVLKEVNDALGKHFYANMADVTILRFEDDSAVVDGFIFIEPVICTDDDRVGDKTRVKLES